MDEPTPAREFTRLRRRAAATAHDINNALTYMMYDLQCLADALPRWAGVLGPQDQDDLREWTREALTGCERIRNLARDLEVLRRPAVRYKTSGMGSLAASRVQDLETVYRTD